jgi:hypothetical protein
MDSWVYGSIINEWPRTEEWVYGLEGLGVQLTESVLATQQTSSSSAENMVQI